MSHTLIPTHTLKPSHIRSSFSSILYHISSLHKQPAMSSVSKPPANDSPICDTPIGYLPAGNPCVGSAGCPSSTAGNLFSCNQSISTNTPIHSCYNTTVQYGINCLDRTRTCRVLATNVAPYILGPRPPNAFLDRFFPLDSISIPSPPSF